MAGSRLKYASYYIIRLGNDTRPVGSLRRSHVLFPRSLVDRLDIAPNLERRLQTSTELGKVRSVAPYHFISRRCHDSRQTSRGICCAQQ